MWHCVDHLPCCNAVWTTTHVQACQQELMAGEEGKLIAPYVQTASQISTAISLPLPTLCGLCPVKIAAPVQVMCQAPASVYGSCVCVICTANRTSADVQQHLLHLQCWFLYVLSMLLQLTADIISS